MGGKSADHRTIFCHPAVIACKSDYKGQRDTVNTSLQSGFVIRLSSLPMLMLNFSKSDSLNDLVLLYLPTYLIAPLKSYSLTHTKTHLNTLHTLSLSLLYLSSLSRWSKVHCLIFLKIVAKFFQVSQLHNLCVYFISASTRETSLNHFVLHRQQYLIVNVVLIRNKIYLAYERH